MFFNPYDLIFVLPAMLLAFYAQFKVQNTFGRFSQVRTQNGMTGAEAARRILDSNGLYNVKIKLVNGFLSDHYDPRDKTLNLSPEVYNGSSIAALGVAAHETGHAIQHSHNYLPLKLRSSLVPAASFGSSLAMPLILVGFLIQTSGLIWLGIILFSLAVAFQVVTLPVEFNASKRAIAALDNGGFLSAGEIGPAKKVLSAAALTYLAAAITAVAQLVSLLMNLFMSNSDE